MRYGLSLPTGGECADPAFLAELAERAEASGWDGVFLEDYVFWQGDPAVPTCDTWVALAAMATRTRSARLGTSVTPLARRRPWNVARQAVGIDQLSEGRMVLGVGLGDTGEAIGADASFTRLGEEMAPRRRAQILDEALEIIAGLWTGEQFAFLGQHFVVEEVTFLPTPVQQPRIPIWVGGGYPNRGPTRRAARWDGSLLYKETHGGPWEDMSPDDVRAIRELAGGKPFDIKVGGRGRSEDEEADREWVRAMETAGATWSSEYVPPADRESMRAAVDRGPLRID
jgi:alkanesulfonate monooxygenase SsuD/methylene tetrahydromethanopterin reductase-like flavin-dependent oxidoreductase (luciferase family)